MVVPSRRKKFLKKVMAMLLVLSSLVASIEAKGRGGGGSRGRGRSSSSGGTEWRGFRRFHRDPTYSGDWGPCEFFLLKKVKYTYLYFKERW